MQLIGFDSPEEEFRISKIVKNDHGGYWTSFKEKSILNQFKKCFKTTKYKLWSRTKCNCTELVVELKVPKLEYNDCNTKRYSICYRENIKTIDIEIITKELKDGE